MYLGIYIFQIEKFYSLHTLRIVLVKHGHRMRNVIDTRFELQNQGLKHIWNSSVTEIAFVFRWIKSKRSCNNMRIEINTVNRPHKVQFLPLGQIQQIHSASPVFLEVFLQPSQMFSLHTWEHYMEQITYLSTFALCV